MREHTLNRLGALAAGLCVVAASCSTTATTGRGSADGRAPAASRGSGAPARPSVNVQLGPRPFYLVQGMDDGPLKDKLASCQDGPFSRSDFSIAHRGAALMMPEHSDVAYEAGARMGAGIVECDVAFTKDGELVCRHGECDLATTTNIVNTPLNAKCTVPWKGPVPANPRPVCCTSDLTLAEFKSLEAKMDASDGAAATSAGFLGGTAAWRTDLYTGRAHVVTLRESIRLNERNGVKHTPELKYPTYPARVATIFGGQEKYAQAIVDVLQQEGVDPRNVFLQSFHEPDIRYWIQHAPAFGQQAVLLDGVDPTAKPPIPRKTAAELQQLRAQGVRILAPPFQVLLEVDAAGRIVPSAYAQDIQRAGLEIIAWSFERTDLRRGSAGAGGYYLFDPTGKAIRKDADMYQALDVLAREVKILGLFSDWPATVTYYANCMGLK